MAGTDERLREEPTGTDERLREEPTGTDERLRDEPTGMAPCRALITEAAAELLRTLQDRYGALMFHQSGGCCDGSSPMCYPDGEFLVGDRDVLLSILDVGHGVSVWISGSQFETWKHTQLVIDVVPGRGGGFSLEAPDGMRFLSRGRVFTPDEIGLLDADPPVTGWRYERGERPRDRGTCIVARGVDACPVPAARPVAAQT